MSPRHRISRIERLGKVVVVTGSCLALWMLVQWVILGGRFLAIPIIATFLSGVFIVIWVFNRQAPDDPGGLLWREERARRRERGLCLRCGYDLTGNSSGKCPECGTKIESE